MSHLVVQHHDVARVSVEPRVDGFAHAADFVQRWRVKVRPAKLQNLIETEPENMSHMLDAHASMLRVGLWTFVPCGLALIARSSTRSGSVPERTKRSPVSCENVTM